MNPVLMNNPVNDSAQDLINFIIKTLHEELNTSIFNYNINETQEIIIKLIMHFNFSMKNIKDLIIQKLVNYFMPYLKLKYNAYIARIVNIIIKFIIFWYSL